MEQVIIAINHNAAAIPTLWTQLDYTATIVDPQKQTTDTFSGDGSLIYARPISLLLDGNANIAGKAFELGSNGDEFWVQVRASADSFNYWWGNYKNLGRPGCKPIPIRPDMVLHVLGIGLYEPNFLEQPVPVMRFDNDADAYIFDRNVTVGDHWETQEEIWYDRQTKLPKRVLIYGENGRIVLKADLSDQVPVEVRDKPQDQWPKVAKHYDLTFVDTQSHISFDFYTPKLKNKIGPAPAVPNGNTFIRQDPEGKNNIIQIDADVNQ